MSIVYLGGSRHLSTLSPSHAQVIRSVIASGAIVHVGCATGADQLVLSLALSLSPSSLRVFAAFAQSGAGAWSGSAVQVVRSAHHAGVPVSWLAGGGLQVPLVARLIARSVAGLRGASAAVFFAPGAGSLKVAGVAVERGIPVFAFSASAPGAPHGCAGQWVASSFRGQPCWQWQSAQLSFF